MYNVYVETTIPSYLVGKRTDNIIILGHRQITSEWWQRRRKEYKLFISDVVIEEISAGNPSFAEKRIELLAGIPVLDYNPKIEPIAAKYMRHFSFPDKLFRDVFHIAYTVYYEMDFLLTWNCKHLANAHIKLELARFNSRLGFRTPEICTPEELLDFHKGD
ncbi:MAG TPA: DNA-binding protein [Lentisphaeria bacterium]|nr:MAG: hypothetical protein A2X48_20530 [Lentisphaerae bacterium GWF2_49_21]HBC86758.1 DNA-binding protein [Lentisphaeria bacterium]